MRDKSKSWEQPCMRVAFENGATYLKGHRFDPYLYYYYSPYLKNKPCLDCAFTDHSCADLTLGDFWGYRKEKIENDGQGMSLVCAYTDLGKRFIDRPTLAMKLHPLTEKEVSYAFKEKSFTRENRALRDQYIKELGTCDFTELAKRHAFKGGVVGIVAKRIKKKLFKT